MPDLVVVLIASIASALLASCLISLPTLFTFQVWESASSRTWLHLLSGAYASLWSMIYVGGIKYLTDASISTIFWFVVFWLLSLNVVKHVLPSNRKAFYLFTCLGRFSVLTIFLIMIFTYKEDPLNRVYAESSLIVISVLFAGVYLLSSTNKSKAIVTDGVHMDRGNIKETWKFIGMVLGAVYVVGIVITHLLLIIMERVECVQNNGWTGFFWCPDWFFVVLFTGFFRALLWPYLLWNWLFG